MMLPRTATLLAVLLCVVAGCSRATSDKRPSQSEFELVGGPAPGQEDAPQQARATDVRPRVVSPEEFRSAIAEYRGRVVFVDYWATWCVTCVERFPQTVRWSKLFRDTGLVVCSVSLNEPEERDSVAKFLRQQDADFPNFISWKGGHLSSFSGFDIEGGIPFFQIYGRDGKLLRTFEGSDSEAEIDLALREALRQDRGAPR